jgi:hypothetical protein
LIKTKPAQLINIYLGVIASNGLEADSAAFSRGKQASHSGLIDPGTLGSGLVAFTSDVFLAGESTTRHGRLQTFNLMLPIEGPAPRQDMLQYCHDHGFDGITTTLLNVTESATTVAAPLAMPQTN